MSHRCLVDVVNSGVVAQVGSKAGNSKTGEAVPVREETDMRGRNGQRRCKTYDSGGTEHWSRGTAYYGSLSELSSRFVLRTWRTINRMWFLILPQARSSFLSELDDGCSTFSSHQPSPDRPRNGFYQLAVYCMRQLSVSASGRIISCKSRLHRVSYTPRHCFVICRCLGDQHF